MSIILGLGRSRARQKGGRLRLFSLMLVVSLLAQLPTALGRAEEPENPPQDPPSSQDAVLEDLQTPTAKTIAIGDGEFETKLYNQPVQFETNDGAWRAIDSDLVDTNEDGFDLTNAANDFDVLVDRQLSGEYLQVEHQGEEFALSMPAADPSSAEVSGDRVTYPDVFDDVDLHYDVLADGVKETIVLKDATAPTSYSFELTTPASGLTPLKRTDGGYDFYLPGETEPVFTLESPSVVDASIEPEPEPLFAPATMAVTSVDDHTFAVELSVDDSWFQDPDRSFPVLLDPTITIQRPDYSTDDASFAWDCPTCEATTANRVLIGGDGTYAKWRSAFEFTLDALPDQADITAATFMLRYDSTCLMASCGGTSHTINAHRIFNGWSTESKPGFGFSDTPFASNTFTANGTAKWLSWDATQLTKDWFLGNQTNHGILLKRSTESLNSNGPKLIGRRYTNDQLMRPKLEVTWSDDRVNLLPIQVTHSNGAELEWTPYVLGDFSSYEVHRSSTAGFTPSADTLLTRIGEVTESTYIDTTAKENSNFTYKIVVNGSKQSNERTVTTPVSGNAIAVLQPGPEIGEAVEIDNYGTDCENAGVNGRMRVGSSASAVYRGLLRFDLSAIPADSTISSAQLDLYHEATTNQLLNSTVRLHQLETDWAEGTGKTTCSDDGVTWVQPRPGASWTGGDLQPTSDVVATTTASSRSESGWDTFSNLQSLVSKWVKAEAPHDGLAVTLQNETLAASNNFYYYTDDYGVSSRLRPKLTVNYSDGSQSLDPVIETVYPAPDENLRGSAAVLRAAAEDDGTVDKVDFVVNGNVVGTDFDQNADGTFSYDWNLPGNGEYTLVTKAYDEVGQTTSSETTDVTVDDSSISTVVANPPEDAVTGNVPLEATVSGYNQDIGIKYVEFLVDGKVIARDQSAPYEVSWNTLQSPHPSYNGERDVRARVVTNSGLRKVSPKLVPPIQVDHTQTTGKESYDAELTLATGSDPVPIQIPRNPLLQDDEHDVDESYPADPQSLTDPPVDSWAPGPNGRERLTGTEVTYPFEVTVKNNSDQTWTTTDYELWYRWVNSEDEVVFESLASEQLTGSTLAPGVSQTLDLDVVAPSLPPNIVSADYELRVDIFDEDAGTWFASEGSQPFQSAVQVDDDLDNALGLERYFHYDAEPVGAGMTHLTNIANGNSILRLTPFSSPGRGLSTVVDLTYNSLNDNGQPPQANNPNVGQGFSPVGANFHLSISSLVQFGGPLEMRPPSSSANPGSQFVAFTDGDGTTHRFTYQNGRWVEPPGVNLFLDKTPCNTTQQCQETAHRRWVITRPDQVSFNFDEQGWPRSVIDRNGNTIRFEYDEDVPDSEDPGGPDKRIIEVRDPAYGESGAGERSFKLDYYVHNDDALSPQVAGNVKTITDHSGHVLTFDYYDDGNLRQITQEGDTEAGSVPVEDRTFTFTYTTPSGAAAALGEAERHDPPWRVPSQSTRLYSVIDPRGHETAFAYYTSGHRKWMLQSRTNRLAQATIYTYDDIDTCDPSATVWCQTTVDKPLGRQAKFKWDEDGKVHEISHLVDADPDVFETTELSWNEDDFWVSKVTEPSDEYQEFVFNSNGYLTDHWDQLRNHTVLSYDSFAVNGADAGSHLSNLKKITKPKGGVWEFFYDPNKKNIDYIKDPEGGITDLTYATNGTLTDVIDANQYGLPTPYGLRLSDYDPNGFPEKVTREMHGDDLITMFDFDSDGQMLWMQDPEHYDDFQTNRFPNDIRSYRMVFDYDSFHRLVKTTQPRSSNKFPGQYVVSETRFDENDNVKDQIGPEYEGKTNPTAPPVVKFEYDEMDQQLKAAGPEDGVETVYDYDEGGRLDTVTSPEGTASSVAEDHKVDYDYDLIDRVIRERRWDQPGSQPRALDTWFCYEELTGDLLWVTPPRAQLSAPCHTSGTDQRPSNFSSGYTYYDDHAVHTKALPPTAESTPRTRMDSFTYDANGNVKTVANANGDTTTYNYDDQDLVTDVIQPLISGSRYTTTHYEYDKVGNLTKVVSPRGVDAAGASANVYATTYEYDPSNRLVRTLLPRASSGEEQVYVHNAYDLNGNLKWTSLPVSTSEAVNVDPLAKTSMTYYDPGWIKTSDDHVNPKVHFDYTPEGWQFKRVPEKSSTNHNLDLDESMSWRYFPDGMLKQRTDQDKGVARYEYDLDNNLKEATDSTGVKDKDAKPFKILGEYDWLGRPAKISHRKNGTSGPFTFTSYSYDLDGNLSTRVDDAVEGGSAGKENRFTYDPAGLLLTHHDLGTNATGCSDDYQTTLTYTRTGWMESKETETGSGTLTQGDCPTWTPKQQTTFSYMANGELDTLTTKSFSPDESTYSTELEHHDVDYCENSTHVPVSCSSANSVYVNGHRTSDLFRLKGPSSAPTGCQVGDPACKALFEYDSRERLVNFYNGHKERTSYSFDQTAHLDPSTVRASSLTTEKTFENASNLADGSLQDTTTFDYVGSQLQEVTANGSTSFYKYDDHGNIDCQVAASSAPCPQGAAVSSNLMVDYDYDGLNRLIEFSQYSFGSVQDQSRFFYDALDRVVRDRKPDTPGGAAETTRYSHLGLTDMVTSETTDGSSEAKNYSFDPFGQRSAMKDTTAGGSTNKYLFGHDVHGSVSLLVNASTSSNPVKASYGYSPYGSEDPDLSNGDTGTNPINPYRFSGKRMDPVSGTLDMGARRFGPSIHSFIQQDVFYSAMSNLGLGTDPLTQNRYSLAGGNPVSFVEADGHGPIDENGNTRSPFHFNQTKDPVDSGLGSGPVEVDPVDWDRGVEKHEQSLLGMEYDPEKRTYVREQLPGFCSDTPDTVGQARARAPACLGANDHGGLPGFENRFRDMTGQYYTQGWREADPGPVGSFLIEQAMLSIIGGPIVSGGKALLQGVRGASAAIRGATGVRTALRACTANSFTSKTRVLMADGTTKKIKDVQVGDSVWAKDPVKSKAGPRRVTATITGHGEKRLVEIGIADNSVVATDGHPFWIDDKQRWVDAEDLQTGDLLVAANGAFVEVDTAIARTRTATVHNLSVKGLHTFFVLAGQTPLLVHNCSDEAWAIARHAADHIDDIPGVNDVDELAHYVNDVMKGPGYTVDDFTTAWWDGSRGAVVIRNLGSPGGGSVFVPNRGYSYFRDLVQGNL
jgi:RHS repeat-associated protein